MRVCNNRDGLPDCCGGCYKEGLCISKYKCEDSLVVNEDLVMQLMIESRRHEMITTKWKQIREIYENLL